MLVSTKNEVTEATGEVSLVSPRRGWSLVKWPVGLALLGILYWLNRTKIDDFFIAPKNWGCLAAALGMIGFSTILTIVRWHLLVSALGIPFHLKDAFRLGFAALFLNFGPGGLVTGDLFKGYFIAREQPGRKAQAAATVLLDRILGLIPLLILGSLASLFLNAFPASYMADGVRWFLWLGSLGGILGLAIMLQPWFTRSVWVRSMGKLPYIGRIFVDVLNGVTLYQGRPRVLGFAIAMGFVGHIVTICGFYYGALGAQV